MRDVKHVFQTNGKRNKDSKLPYRQQVIGALVQRYIESARREFEETKRKGNHDSVTKLSGNDSQTVMQYKVQVSLWALLT